MMTPITRKEKYINQIVGGGDTAPETPQTREEFFFAEILGEVIAPSPVTRVEKYLSAIAGQYSGDLPTPTTRTEYFLARAAGMDVTIPTPITREEIFWSNYSAIVDFEVDGVPPLTYKAVEGTLENYRIYGNTVGGESVGDLVESGEHAGEYEVSVTVEGKNLFDGEIEQGGYDYYGLNVDNELRPYRVRSTNYIPVVGGETYNWNAVSISPLMCHISYYTKNDYTTQRFGYVGWTRNTVFTTPSDCKYIRLLFKTLEDSVITPDDISNVMLNAGSTALPYEPYHAPVTTPIYLPEPIKMVGGEAEYIDYAEQKLHRVRKNLWSGVVEQGSVSTIGTYSDALDRIRSKNISLSPGTYTISCNLGIRCIFAYNNSEKVSCVVDNGGGRIYRNTFTVPSGANNVSVGLRAFDASGAEMDTVKPSDFKWGQIEKGSEATTYEPYIENTEVDVTLPALPTLPGTNVLSVGTAVQPSKVYVKYKGERQ